MTTISTHDGPFHADDVMAVGLLRTFVDRAATVTRSRDPARHAVADFVVDVGGEYDPARGRFDHHQAEYQGPYSSAGMVLDWLVSTKRVDERFGARMRTGLMAYLDDVDTGRVAPKPDVPCFPRIVEALNQPADSHAAFDAQFEIAAGIAAAWLHGLVAEHRKLEHAERVVTAAMADAVRTGSRFLDLPNYLPWKNVYFANGGAEHPTEFVLHPGTDGSWRVVAIPPRPNDFGQKRPLPEAWAGLTDEALEAVTGIPGSVFCHKNRFIAVFRTREGALAGLRQAA